MVGLYRIIAAQLANHCPPGTWASWDPKKGRAVYTIERPYTLPPYDGIEAAQQGKVPN